MMTFALIGAAGYVAPRHMQAIKDTGNRVVAALDLNDSVGILDSFFPEADFFTEFERFDRHVDLLRRKGHAIDYISICSPNYLHDSHVRFALRSGASVICEKPLVLNPWNIDGLRELEQETGRRTNTILQLRLHPTIIALKEKVEADSSDRLYDIDLAYITSRGHWYHVSWKGDVKKSGGIATNIGVHFFDMLSFVFGAVKENIVHYSSEGTAAGYLQLERARVRWFLSVDAGHLPQHVRDRGERTFRSITIDGSEIDFTAGFEDLHTVSYRQILEGRGFELEENRTAIQTVSAIRKTTPTDRKGACHPFLETMRT